MYKYLSKKIANSLGHKVDEIRKSLDYSKQRLASTEIMLKEIKEEKAAVEQSLEQTVIRAKTHAEKILTKAQEKINTELRQKETEYNSSLKKIQDGAYKELQNKIVDLVAEKVLNELKNNSKDIHQQSFDKSINMLKDLYKQ